MKGYIEIDPFQKGEYRGSFVVLARDVVSPSFGVCVRKGMWRLIGLVGQPARVARVLEGARQAPAHPPARVQAV